MRDIRRLIRERRRMSLRELCIHFRIEAGALEPMMDTLVRKGQVRRLEGGCPLGKGTCRGCACAEREDILCYAAREDDTDPK